MTIAEFEKFKEWSFERSYPDPEYTERKPSEDGILAMKDVYTSVCFINGNITECYDDDDIPYSYSWDEGGAGTEKEDISFEEAKEFLVSNGYIQ